MSIAITRKLEYADRVAVQQADQAIRKDVVRALVELITNSNDSYQRMEDSGTPNEGRIIIELQRKHADSILRVSEMLNLTRQPSRNSVSGLIVLTQTSLSRQWPRQFPSIWTNMATAAKSHRVKYC